MYAARAYAGSPPWTAAVGREGVWEKVSLKVWIAIAAHVPLALAMHRVPHLATAHALLVLVVGLLLTLSGRIERVAYVAAYIAGAEVLWRMCHAAVFHEYGKYLMSLVFLAAIFARGLRVPSTAILFFALLLPGAMLTALSVPLDEARRNISFNLSGPFCLAAAVGFFSSVSLGRREFRNLALAYLAPATAISAIAAYSLLTASKITFTGESLSVTSGQYGPNQVSSALGLAALFAFLVVLVQRRSLGSRTILIGAVLLFATQSALTFSRSGLYMSLLSIVVAGFYFARTRRVRRQLIVACCLICGSAVWFIIPRVDRFTDGAIIQRFQQTNVTRRDKILWADLAIWSDHAIVGVGPGMAAPLRPQHGAERLAAHTEYTRLLAEHGLLGAAALVMLVLMARRGWKRARGKVPRALVTALLAWSLLYMLVNGMRLAAPGFMFALAMAYWWDEDDQPQLG
jgi:O-antigen ligase